MTQQFTASDVRRTAAAIEDKQMLVSSMLRAFADLLEAQEKAVPFGYAYRYWDGIRFDTGGREINGSKPTATIPLYTHTPTHPAPSDAERLAEALRRTCRKMKTFSRTGALDGAVAVWVDEIESVLATHSAQAQPPSVSVTDDYREIARLIGSIFFAGGFKAETPNEIALEFLLRKTGNWFESWDGIPRSLLAAQEIPNG